jgi:hypothetical protein
MDAKEFIVATDNGMMHKLRTLNPDKVFIEAPTAGNSATCKSCAHCPWMAMNGLAGLAHVLETGANESAVDPALGDAPACRSTACWPSPPRSRRASRPARWCRGDRGGVSPSMGVAFRLGARAARPRVCACSTRAAMITWFGFEGALADGCAEIRFCRRTAIAACKAAAAPAPSTAG